MKIKKSLFMGFVKESSLSGDSSLREVKLDFGEKGLMMSSVSEGNAILVKAIIPSKSFEDYSEFGKIAILDYTELQKIIGTMTDDITIKKDGNVLILSGGRKVEIPLADENTIKDITKMPNLEYPYSFIIGKKFFDEIISNISFSINKSDSPTIQFIGKDKTLMAKYGTKYKFEDSMVVDKMTDEVNVVFGEPLLNAVNNLSGDIEVKMKSNYPITITKISDMYQIMVIIAPKIVSND